MLKNCLIVSMAVALLTGLFAASAAAQERPAESSQKPAVLRVATYNIRYDNPGDGPNAWPHRREAMARYLAEIKPDIVGLQEAEHQQIEYLAEKLTDYRWYGVGRTDGKQGGEATPIFYRPDRLEPLDQGSFWLSEQPDTAGSKGWDAALPRVASWIKFRDKASGREFLAMCTHFDHIGRQARQESGRLVRQRAAQIAGDLPIVLVGDFNSTPGSAPYQALTADSGDDTAAAPAFLDAKKVTKTPHEGPDSTSNGFRRIPENRQIDFVFVRGFDVARHRIDDPRVEGRFVSDHLPIVAELQFAGREK